MKNLKILLRGLFIGFMYIIGYSVGIIVFICVGIYYVIIKRRTTWSYLYCMYTFRESENRRFRRHWIKTGEM